MEVPPSPRNSAPQDLALELLLDRLVRTDERDPFDIEALCSERPDLAEELRRLWIDHQPRSQKRSAAIVDMLRGHFGGVSVPNVSLSEEEHDSGGGPPPELSTNGGPQGTRYRIIGEIARGGMGAIFRAWDGDLRRPLALKIASERPDPSTTRGATSLARFLEEAQITGQLDHPGIVPVHELGLDNAGRLYFTMRLVKGRELKRVFELAWREEEDWTLTRVLHVFLKVCETLAYAHVKGVIHRDLKPANVMVGRFGEVYVMDWGVARVLGRADRHDLRLRTESVTQSEVQTDRHDLARADPDSSIVTMDGDVVGTPAYMSPEQARGELDRLSVRSDVYSVGAMLYQLLTQETPFVPRGVRVSPAMVLMRLLERPPQPIHALNPRVPVELVAICDKAMARDPSQRYADTLEMKADLEAWLDNRVVRAHRTGAFVELAKWTQRNKALATACATVLVVSVVGFAVSLYAHRELKAKNIDLTLAKDDATRNAVMARDEAAASERLLAFMTEMFDRQKPSEARGGTITVKEVLDSFLARVGQTAAEKPEVRVRLLESMGELYASLSQYPQAKTLYRQALAESEHVAGSEDRRTLHLAYRLAYVLHVEAHWDDAEQLYVTTHEIQRRTLGERDPDTLRTANELAYVRMQLERLGESEAGFLATLEARTETLGEEDPETLKTLNDLGNLYKGEERWSDAEPLLRRALAGRRKILGSDDPDTLTTMNLLAGIALHGKRLEQAEELLDEALASALWVQKEHHHRTLPILQNMADLRCAQGRYGEAEDLLRRIMAAAPEAFPLDHRDIMHARIALAKLHRSRGRLPEAADLLCEVLEAVAARPNRVARDIMDAERELAEIELELGRLEQAREHATQLLAQTGPKHPSRGEREELLRRIEAAIAQDAGRRR